MGDELLEIDTRPPGPRSDFRPAWKSVMVGWVAGFPSGLLVMTTLAKAAPVAPIPEERCISPVRFDVIDHRCLNVASFL